MEKRKNLRFNDSFFMNVDLVLQPVAPLFGASATGRLVDLSAGGMALLLNEVLPKKVFLKMSMKLPDGTKIESVVTVCHIAPQKPHGFLHGIQFLNIDPETAARIDLLAQDSISCGTRIANNSPEVCVADCSLHGLCKKKECATRAIQAVLITLKAAEDPEEQAVWEYFDIKPCKKH